MKMRRKTPGEHLVPLSRQVVTLLTDLQAITGGNPNGLLLPGLVAGKPISDATLGQALKRLGCGPNRIVPHGFRAMASTQLNEQGFAPDLIELQLAHSDSSMRGIYNRATRLPERREMMRWWADRLDALHTAPLRDRTSPASLDGEGGVAALVRNMKANSGRWAALLTVMAVAAVTAGVQAASVPLVDTIAAAGIIAVVGIQRFAFGTGAARRLTLQCEQWVQDVRSAMRRGGIKCH